MTRGQLPNIPEPAPSLPPAGTVRINHVYDGTCDACGNTATEHGWVIISVYEPTGSVADINVERTGWCGELSCAKARAHWVHILDRVPAWEGHNAEA